MARAKVEMSKRPSCELPPPARKERCSSSGATQSTLHMFFKSGAETARPKTVEYIPQYLGIHTYSEGDIADSSGLDKEYKEFWNAKATELCQDKAVRQKLQDKAAIQGAINSLWTLHKSDLLQLQADELAVCVNHTYTDETRQAYALSTVESNLKKMMELTDSLRLVYVNATEEMGDEVSDLMKKLRKSQSALKKAIDRKNHELHQIKTAQPLTAAAPEAVNVLSTDELQDLIQEIKKDDFEPDSNPGQEV